MMKKMFTQVITFSFILSTIGGCGRAPASDSEAKHSANPPIVMQEATLPAANGLSAAQQQWRTELIKVYSNQSPSQWGENVSGVFTHMATNDKSIALTFDACGGTGGN